MTIFKIAIIKNCGHNFRQNEFGKTFGWKKVRQSCVSFFLSMKTPVNQCAWLWMRKRCVLVELCLLETQLNRYMVEIADADDCSALEFWRSRRASYSNIAQITEDLLSAPASQAYVECIFSCGMLTTGWRNHMQHTLLETSVSETQSQNYCVTDDCQVNYQWTSQ